MYVQKHILHSFDADVYTLIISGYILIIIW